MWSFLCDIFFSFCIYGSHLITEWCPKVQKGSFLITCKDTICNGLKILDQEMYCLFVLIFSVKVTATGPLVIMATLGLIRMKIKIYQKSMTCCLLWRTTVIVTLSKQLSRFLETSHLFLYQNYKIQINC